VLLQARSRPTAPARCQAVKTLGLRSGTLLPVCRSLCCPEPETPGSRSLPMASFLPREREKRYFTLCAGWSSQRSGRCTNARLAVDPRRRDLNKRWWLPTTLSRLVTSAARLTSPSGSPANASRTRSGEKRRESLQGSGLRVLRTGDRRDGIQRGSHRGGSGKG
jgi:hypothetical protein